MPTWGNTDVANQKPKFDYERTTREVIQLALFANANTTTNGTSTIQVSYNDGAGNNVANIGVATGQYVYVAGQGAASSGVSANGYPGFFTSNVTVSGISGNTITLSSNITSNIVVGTTIEFDKAIAYNTNKGVETTYNQDTILVTPTRLNNTAAPIGVNGSQANVGAGITTTQVGNISQGWVHIQKKTNNDGTVRYLKETLVALANPVAANTNSGNTSFGQFLTGL